MTKLATTNVIQVLVNAMDGHLPSRTMAHRTSVTPGKANRGDITGDGPVQNQCGSRIYIVSPTDVGGGALRQNDGGDTPRQDVGRNAPRRNVGRAAPRRNVGGVSLRPPCVGVGCLRHMMVGEPSILGRPEVHASVPQWSEKGKGQNLSERKTSARSA